MALPPNTIRTGLGSSSGNSPPTTAGPRSHFGGTEILNASRPSLMPTLATGTSMAMLVLRAVFKITLQLRTTPRTPLSTAATLAVAMVAVAASDVATELVTT